MVKRGKSQGNVTQNLCIDPVIQSTFDKQLTWQQYNLRMQKDLIILFILFIYLFLFSLQIQLQRKNVVLSLLFTFKISASEKRLPDRPFIMDTKCPPAVSKQKTKESLKKSALSALLLFIFLFCFCQRKDRQKRREIG